MNTYEEIVHRVCNLNSDQQMEIVEILRNMQADEKRDYKRYCEPMPIDVLAGDKLIQSVMKDISASGVFIKNTGKIDPDKDVRVCFSVPGAEKPFKLEGSIVRSESTGLAVAFKHVSSYLAKILNETARPAIEIISG